VNTDQTFAIVLILIASVVFGTVKVLKGPIGTALSRRLTGSLESHDHDEEVSQLRARVAELEERMDFTERVLLQQPERGQVLTGGEQG
jgi:hypothetical protein